MNRISKLLRLSLSVSVCPCVFDSLSLSLSLSLSGGCLSVYLSFFLSVDLSDSLFVSHLSLFLFLFFARARTLFLCCSLSLVRRCAGSLSCMPLSQLHVFFFHVSLLVSCLSIYLLPLSRQHVCLSISYLSPSPSPSPSASPPPSSLPALTHSFSHLLSLPRARARAPSLFHRRFRMKKFLSCVKGCDESDGLIE